MLRAHAQGTLALRGTRPPPAGSLATTSREQVSLALHEAVTAHRPPGAGQPRPRARAPKPLHTEGCRAAPQPPHPLLLSSVWSPQQRSCLPWSPPQPPLAGPFPQQQQNCGCRGEGAPPAHSSPPPCSQQQDSISQKMAAAVSTQAEGQTKCGSTHSGILFGLKKEASSIFRTFHSALSLFSPAVLSCHCPATEGRCTTGCSETASRGRTARPPCATLLPSRVRCPMPCPPCPQSGPRCGPGPSGASSHVLEHCPDHVHSTREPRR